MRGDLWLRAVVDGTRAGLLDATEVGANEAGSTHGLLIVVVVEV